MKKIRFAPLNITLEVPAGTTILEAAREAGLSIESPCNGAGVCGKCKLPAGQIAPIGALLIKKSKAAPAEQDYILACQACLQDDLIVSLAQVERDGSLKILSTGKSFVYDFDPAVKKCYHPESDTTTVFLDGKRVAEEQGSTQNNNQGIVIDIGTTTLVASLIDLNTGEEIASESALNPQAVHAQDVLSRIHLAAEEGGLRLLYREIIKEINRLIEIITARSAVDAQKIYEIVFSGNTCMIHLATNADPASLGKYPYRAKISGGSYDSAAGHKIKIAPAGVVYLPPIISSYIGPDITSGVLAAQLHVLAGTTLFVDIGTNGEMVISRDGRLVAASTAAGPAFEGMNIEFGMRAANGAVEVFDIAENGEIKIRTIGDCKTVGVCGSGLLDIVGELVAHKVILKSGKFADPENNSLNENLAGRLKKNGKKPVFYISDDVYITQKDIRQVQLAKGAIRTGIEFLMNSLQITAADVDRVQIAGSFGYHLRAKSLINIGLLPPEFADKIEFVGNTSKTGGQAFLLNRSHKTEMKRLTERVEVIELTDYENFDKVFVRFLNF
ncbi:MAG TPA: ASKHA domain-containing protein [Desulfitobacteriaceae bacterium]|nr:ASKHA domain-containing protein [Desulfitobacteriaceae bacterium]